MSTWFDRPLTIAGRVIVRGADTFNPETMLLHVQRPLLQISNLAIHFNRQVNDGVKLSRQKDVLPLLGRFLCFVMAPRKTALRRSFFCKLT